MRIPRIVAVATIVFAGAAAEATAQGGSRQSAAAVFSESHPGASTGLRVAIDYVNPADRDAKPPAVAKVVVALDPGAKIDTSVPSRCQASEAELIASGAAACPAASKVGNGEIDVDTGVPGPERFLRNNVTFLNNTGELIFLIESKTDPPTRVVLRAKIEGATVTSDAPPLPGGPPDGFAAVKRVRLNLARRGGYVRTPARCPASRSWTSTMRFTYRDGVSQAVTSRSPCTGTTTGADYKAPRIRVGGVPRRRCASRDFRARVRIAERWSGLRSARVSLDRRRVITTGRKAFSPRIPARRLRSRRHLLTVVALDRAGNRSVKRMTFRRCRR
jgi:hypothetical protein